MNAALDSEKEKLMVKYLLGELFESEKTRFEEHFFESDDDFAELLAAEDNLIARYLSGDLSPIERANFERHFMASPRRSKHVETVRSIRETIERNTIVRVSGPAVLNTESGRPTNIFARWRISQWAFAATFLIIVIGGSWLVWRGVQPRQTIDRIEAERATLQQQKEESEGQTNIEREQDQQLSKEPQSVRNSRPESDEQANVSRREIQRSSRRSQDLPPLRPSVLTFFLTPGLSRATGQGRTLKLSNSTRTVVLKLNLTQDEYSSYQASLQTPEGSEVWRSSRLKSQQRPTDPFLAFSIPARSMRRGDYILTLSGETSLGQMERINQYVFTAVIE